MEKGDLSQVIDVLNQVSDLLYQNNIEYAYKLLALIIRELEIVISEQNDEELKNKLREKLTEALEAMETEDYVLLADILQYEIIELLQSHVS